MVLKYSGESINSPDGISCKVLNTNTLDFSNFVFGRKTIETLVRKAEGGEKIETKNSDMIVEAVYIAKPGDAIFINLHNSNDMYVPGNPDGSRWKFSDLTSKGYEITGEDHERGGVLVKSTTKSKLLHEIIQEPTCLKDAWGKGQHQFLFNGATLKQGDNGRVTGIDKEAFDKTWEIISPSKPPNPPLSPRP